MTDRRQRTYSVSLGGMTAEVLGVAGICELLPDDAASELRARRASFYAALSAGAGSLALRLTALPHVVLHVTRHAPVPSQYRIEVWRGRTINARTIDPMEPVKTFEGHYLGADVLAFDPAVADAIQRRLPSIRSRLSTSGEAYIQVALADGVGLGVRITRKG